MSRTLAGLRRTVNFDKEALEVVEKHVLKYGSSFNEAVNYLLKQSNIRAKQVSQRLVDIQEQTNFIYNQIKENQLSPNSIGTGLSGIIPPTVSREARNDGTFDHFTPPTVAGTLKSAKQNQSISQSADILHTNQNQTINQQNQNSCNKSIHINKTKNNQSADIFHTNQEQRDTSNSNSNAVHLYIHVTQE